MKVRTMFLTALAGVLVTLAGCSAGTCSSPVAAPTPSGPAVVHVPGTAYSGNEVRLQCADSLTPVELGIGKHTEPDAVYALVENRGPKYPYDSVQTSVTLHAQPPKGSAVTSAIVHSVDSVDREFQVNIGPGGVVDAQLVTANYSYLPYYYQYYPISSVTLCIRPTG